MMRRPPSLIAQPGDAAPPKASVVELAVLLGLCLLAGVGAGLAFASALVGLAVAGIGLIAVAAYALATNIDRRPRNRREEQHRLSVTDISTRRPAAPRPAERAPTPEPDEAPDAAAIVATPVEPERVVPFRAPPMRL